MFQTTNQRVSLREFIISCFAIVFSAKLATERRQFLDFSDIYDFMGLHQNHKRVDSSKSSILIMQFSFPRCLIRFLWNFIPVFGWPWSEVMGKSAKMEINARDHSCFRDGNSKDHTTKTSLAWKTWRSAWNTKRDSQLTYVWENMPFKYVTCWCFSEIYAIRACL